MKTVVAIIKSANFVVVKTVQHTREKACQWLLTARYGWAAVGGGVLNASKRVIDGEHVGDMLCTLHADMVSAKAANKGRNGGSMAADSNGKVRT